jgi:hypothetical protein
MPASSDLIGSRRPQPCDVDQDQRYAAFAAFGAATVHEAQGGTGALDSAIKPLSPDTVVAGPALTVDTRPGDNLALHYAMTVARSGYVLGSNPTRPTSEQPNAIHPVEVPSRCAHLRASGGAWLGTRRRHLQIR